MALDRVHSNLRNSWVTPHICGEVMYKGMFLGTNNTGMIISLVIHFQFKAAEESAQTLRLNVTLKQLRGES